MNKNNFCLLVIGSLVLAIAAGVCDIFWSDPITEKISNYAYEIDPGMQDENLVYFGAFAVFSLLLAAASIIGLLMFKNWGRHLYLAGFFLYIPLYPFMGVTVSSGLSQVFYDLSMIASGSILALIYFSPVAQYFQKQQ